MRYDTNMKQKRDKGKASRGIFHYDLPKNGTERGKNGQSLSSPGVFLPRHCSIILPQKIGRGNEERERGGKGGGKRFPTNGHGDAFVLGGVRTMASERKTMEEKRRKERKGGMAAWGLCNTF